MVWRRNKVLLKSFFICLLFLLSKGYAIEESKGFELNKKSWEEKKQEYKYAPIEENKVDKDVSEPNESKEELSFNWSINNGVVKIIVISIIIIAIATIFFRLLLFGNFKSNTKLQSKSIQFSIEELEENLEESDLDQALKYCLNNGDYKSAIRIYYLMIIKTLSEQKLIDWKKDKTNYQYLIELQDHKTSDEFSLITIKFERVWYGDQVVSKELYKAISSQFLNYLNLLSDEK